MEKRILCYTRRPEEDGVYSRKLADSMHLALVDEKGVCTPLNHNSGILYAKAVQRRDGVLVAKSLKNPWLFAMADGGFGVLAVRIEADGAPDAEAEGKLLFFTSQDLIRYQEHELLDLGRGEHIQEAACRYEGKQYVLEWKEWDGKRFQAVLEGFSGKELSEMTISRMDIPERNIPFRNASAGPSPAAAEEPGMKDGQAELLEKKVQEGELELPKGAQPCNLLEIPAGVADRLAIRLLPPMNTANEVPAQVRASSLEELARVKAVARYSDGTSVEKRVDWYAGEVDFTRPGTYQITGRVHQEHYEFPIAWHRADPCIGKWKGKYYFIATNDYDNNHSLFIREADTIPGLATAQESLILDTSMYPHLGNLLWAPEFHIIKDRLYIFHAGTPGEFEKEQCHVMALKENGNPMKASDWEKPVRVVKKDGSFLYNEQGITLDMTEWEVNGRYYAAWSQRQFFPVDQGAWLYLAEIDPDQPWRLISDPVLLSMPEYGWANNHTFVDEGPFALFGKDKIFLTFSSAAVDSTYVVGLLSADLSADLLAPASWTKENYPLMSSRSKEGEFGTGHNSYVTDEDGLVWNAYHGRPGIEGPRSSGLRRVHFGPEGDPVLDLTEERDLAPELAWVSMQVVVE